MLLSCIDATETFKTLLFDKNHWLFELLVGGIETLFLDVILGMLLWPFVQKLWKCHSERDKREGVAHTKAALSEAEQARRSFAYGNAHLSNPAVTRDMIDRAAEQIERGKSQQRIWVSLAAEGYIDKDGKFHFTGVSIVKEPTDPNTGFWMDVPETVGERV